YNNIITGKGKMKFTLYLITFLFFFNLFANDKTKLEEGEVIDSEKIKFQNKSSKKAAEETKYLNELLGKNLAEMISEKPGEAHSKDGLKVIRVASREKDKFGADVIQLDTTTNFGHIHSLHRILSAYIQTAFDYNNTRADILAIYILYYNGMHRGDIRYFKSKYTKYLVNKINPSHIGIATKFKEWPGKTEIIIPIELNILKKNKSDLPIDELENEVSKIINEKKNGDRDKKEFDEFKKAKIQEELNEINQKFEELENKEKEIDERQSEILKKLKELYKDPEKNKDEIAKLEKEYNQLNRKKKKIQKYKKRLIEREEKLTGKKSDKKLSKIVPLPKFEVIIVDPRYSEPEYSSDIINGKLVFIKPMSHIENKCINEIHLLDPTKDDFVYTRNFNNICGNKFEVFGNNILVVGYLAEKDQNRFVILRKNDLKPVGNSEANVYHKTPMKIMGDFLYGIEILDGKYYLTRFDKNLKSLNRSEVEINPDVTISFYGTKIYVSGKNKNGQMEFFIFDKKDLSFIKKTQA
ncbi:MAG: hypothetical protein KDK36_12340, partial [Leptospiraceae bacterium]|nr:hypothetical protein [Leptospiraceae bacterium]